jgi:hypothetical protein
MATEEQIKGKIEMLKTKEKLEEVSLKPQYNFLLPMIIGVNIA